MAKRLPPRRADGTFRKKRSEHRRHQRRKK